MWMLWAHFWSKAWRWSNALIKDDLRDRETKHTEAVFGAIETTVHGSCPLGDDFSQWMGSRSPFEGPKSPHLMQGRQRAFEARIAAGLPALKTSELPIASSNGTSIVWAVFKLPWLTHSWLFHDVWCTLYEVLTSWTEFPRCRSSFLVLRVHGVHPKLLRQVAQSRPWVGMRPLRKLTLMKRWVQGPWGYKWPTHTWCVKMMWCTQIGHDGEYYWYKIYRWYVSLVRDCKNSCSQPYN